MTIVEACEAKTNRTPEFPMGWFSVSRSHELAIGEVKPVKAFDRELVLYRTRSGRVALQDAFCPHLGAHLGHEGRVIGESVRCEASTSFTGPADWRSWTTPGPSCRARSPVSWRVLSARSRVERVC